RIIRLVNYISRMTGLIVPEVDSSPAFRGTLTIHGEPMSRALSPGVMQVNGSHFPDREEKVPGVKRPKARSQAEKEFLASGFWTSAKK
ncbi:hypothetical protein ACT3R5_04190, partial [Glutamicibacter sp. AOP5-A2-7]